MRLDIKGTEITLTPSLREYIFSQLEPLSRFVKRYEENGEIRVFVEIACTTRHHLKGDVFYAEATVGLPEKTIRAEATHEDARDAVDALKDILKKELEKYKAMHIWKRWRRDLFRRMQSFFRR